MISLAGKTAVVTGAARGIGQAITLKLAAAGADIAVCDVKQEWLTETIEKVTALGRKCVGYAANVMVASEVDAAAEAIQKEFGRLDILVNNAGITRDGLLLRMSEEDWDAVLDINLKGTFLFSKACVKYMTKQRSGNVINIASVIGLMGNAGQCNYAASKGGVISFTKSLAKEYAARGIRSNAICPGFIRSAMTDKLSPEVQQKMMDVIPMKQFGTPEDIGNVVVFLASDLSGYITGQAISVCGGMVTH